MKINEYLINFYNHYDEESRLRVKHGMVEFLTAMHYIEKYAGKKKYIHCGQCEGLPCSYLQSAGFHQVSGGKYKELLKAAGNAS